MWKYYPGKHPTRVHKNISIDDGTWWMRPLSDLHIQITATTLQQAFPFIKSAYEQKKPYIFQIMGNLRANMQKMTRTTNQSVELMVQAYGSELKNLNFDPRKINNLSENTVHLYYYWEDIPTALKQFILNKPREVQQTL